MNASARRKVAKLRQPPFTKLRVGYDHYLVTTPAFAFENLVLMDFDGVLADSHVLVVQVPKCASCSLQKYFPDMLGNPKYKGLWRHEPAHILDAVVSPPDTRVAVAIMREPLEWFCSYYKFVRNNVVVTAPRDQADLSTIHTFLRTANPWHQSEFLLDRTGAPNVDVVYKFGDVHAIAQDIAKMRGKPLTVGAQHQNISGGDRCDLTDAFRKDFARVYADDIVLWNSMQWCTDRHRPPHATLARKVKTLIYLRAGARRRPFSPKGR